MGRQINDRRMSHLNITGLRMLIGDWFLFDIESEERRKSGLTVLSLLKIIIADRNIWTHPAEFYILTRLFYIIFPSS